MPDFKNKKLPIYLFMILIIGVFMMIISFPEEKAPIKSTEAEKDEESSGINYENKLERRIENALSKVDGVGNVEVIITLKQGSEKVIATDVVLDQVETKEKEREEKKYQKESKNLLTKDENPIIVTEVSPVIEGVLVICNGGDDIEVKNKIITGIMALLDVKSHKIEVLKMK